MVLPPTGKPGYYCLAHNRLQVNLTVIHICSARNEYSLHLPQCHYPTVSIILFSEKDKLPYTGFTTNIKASRDAHNAGKSKSTGPRKPGSLYQDHMKSVAP